MRPDLPPVFRLKSLGFRGHKTIFPFVDGYNAAIFGSGAKKLEPTPQTRSTFEGKTVPLDAIKNLREQHKSENDFWLAGFYFGCDAAIDAWSNRLMGRMPS